MRWCSVSLRQNNRGALADFIITIMRVKCYPIPLCSLARRRLMGLFILGGDGAAAAESRRMGMSFGRSFCEGGALPCQLEVVCWDDDDDGWFIHSLLG